MTELAFPEIDAPRADVALDKQDLPVLDLRKIDLTDVALAQFGPWRTEVAKLKADNAKTVLDLATQSKIDEAKSLRQRTINAPKAEANKVAAALKSKFAATSKKVGAELEAILAGYDEAAANITLQIDAAQKKIDDEREEKARIERERVAALEAKLSGLSAWIERCKAPGMTAERIAAGIQMLVDSRMGDDWDEFQSRAVARKIEIVDVMRELRAQAVAREAREAEARAEAARLEAQRLENERVAAEQKAEAERLAEQQRLLAEQAAELQRKAEAIAAQERAAAQARAEKEAADREQAAFDVWADRVRPSGDVTDVQIQWEASEDYAELHGIEYQPLIAAIAAQGEADNPAPADAPAEAAPITQDAQSGFVPGTPGLCTSNGAEAAEAPPSGLKGQGAHAEDRAPYPARTKCVDPAACRGYQAGSDCWATCGGLAAAESFDYIPPVVADFELKPQTEAEIQAANGPEVDPLPATDPVWGDRATVSMADINARLGDGITLTSDFLRLTLQIKTAGRERAAYRFYASDWPSIRAGLIDHIEARV
jgi:hypothetical protein